LDAGCRFLYHIRASHKFAFQEQPTILLYSAALRSYALDPMLMIAAALDEELKLGMELCSGRKKFPRRSVSLWQAGRNGKLFYFLKTGVGPRRSAANLKEALKVVRPSHILMIGYAGALDPHLKLGELVSVKKALEFSLDKDNPSWDQILPAGTFELVDWEALVETAKSAGLNMHAGDTLTSRYVLGDPAHKRLLYEKFHAAIVDMETASLARVAASQSVPFSCVRSISDEAEDTFLAPFSFDPSVRAPARAKKLISTGMVHMYREWKKRTSIAGESLSRFLSCNL
jgi:adenosylhomocysteine nucleosidase